MTKKKFKKLWESDDRGGGITFDDIADCAQEWGVCMRPKTMSMSRVRYMVLKAAGTKDAEEWKPIDDRSGD